MNRKRLKTWKEGIVAYWKALSVIRHTVPRRNVSIFLQYNCIKIILHEGTDRKFWPYVDFSKFFSNNVDSPKKLKSRYHLLH
jgi:hypothetical protein